MSDPVILSYFDSLLRQSDIALLEKPNWLNDKIIGFAFQYYQEVNYSFYDPMEITNFRRIQVQPSEYAMVAKIARNGCDRDRSRDGTFGLFWHR